MQKMIKYSSLLTHVGKKTNCMVIYYEIYDAWVRPIWPHWENVTFYIFFCTFTVVGDKLNVFLLCHWSPLHKMWNSLPMVQRLRLFIFLLRNGGGGVAVISMTIYWTCICYGHLSIPSSYMVYTICRTIFCFQNILW